MSSSTTWISFSCFIQNILLCTCLNHLSLASPRFPPVVALKVNPNLFFTLSRSSCCVVTLVSNVQQYLLWNEPFWATSHQRKSLLSCKTPLSLNMKVMRPIKYTRAISWRHLSTHFSNLFFLFGLLVWNPMVARYKLFMCVHPCKPACLSSVKLRGQSTRRQMQLHTFAAGDCKESTYININLGQTHRELLETDKRAACGPGAAGSRLLNKSSTLVKPCSIFLLLVENVIFSVTFSSYMALCPILDVRCIFLKLNFWIVFWSLTVSDFYFWLVWEVYVHWTKI